MVMLLLVGCGEDNLLGQRFGTLALLAPDGAELDAGDEGGDDAATAEDSAPDSPRADGRVDAGPEGGDAQARGDGDAGPVDASGGDSRPLEDSAPGTDSIAPPADSGAPPEAGCTPLPWLQYTCGQGSGTVACLLSNDEACSVDPSMQGECVMVPTACACVETYTCACAAGGATCTKTDAGTLTIERP